jgi:hypothetical protein
VSGTLNTGCKGERATGRAADTCHLLNRTEFPIGTVISKPWERRQTQALSHQRFAVQQTHDYRGSVATFDRLTAVFGEVVTLPVIAYVAGIESERRGSVAFQQR